VLLTQECFEWSFLFPLTLPLLKDNLLKEKCPLFLECQKLAIPSYPPQKTSTQEHSFFISPLLLRAPCHTHTHTTHTTCFKRGGKREGNEEFSMQ